MDLERIRKVTVADVNRVARQYLDLDHAVQAVLTPRGAGRPVSSNGFGGQESISLGEAQSTTLPDWAESALKRLFWKFVRNSPENLLVPDLVMAFTRTP